MSNLSEVQFKILEGADGRSDVSIVQKSNQDRTEIRSKGLVAETLSLPPSLLLKSALLLQAGVIGEHADLAAEAGLKHWDACLEDQGAQQCGL